MPRNHRTSPQPVPSLSAGIPPIRQPVTLQPEGLGLALRRLGESFNEDLKHASGLGGISRWSHTPADEPWIAGLREGRLAAVDAIEGFGFRHSYGLCLMVNAMLAGAGKLLEAPMNPGAAAAQVRCAVEAAAMIAYLEAPQKTLEERILLYAARMLDGSSSTDKWITPATNQKSDRALSSHWMSILDDAEIKIEKNKKGFPAKLHSGSHSVEVSPTVTPLVQRAVRAGRARRGSAASSKGPEVNHYGYLCAWTHGSATVVSADPAVDVHFFREPHELKALLVGAGDAVLYTVPYAFSLMAAKCAIDPIQIRKRELLLAGFLQQLRLVDLTYTSRSTPHLW